MRFKCPNCDQVTEDIELEEEEMKIYFAEEEIALGEALQNQPCSTCLLRTDI